MSRASNGNAWADVPRVLTTAAVIFIKLVENSILSVGSISTLTLRKRNEHVVLGIILRYCRVLLHPLHQLLLKCFAHHELFRH